VKVSTEIVYGLVIEAAFKVMRVLGGPDVV